MPGRILDAAPMTILLVLFLWGAAPGCAQKAGPETTAVATNESAAIPGPVHGVLRSYDGRAVPDVMITATSLDDPARAVPEIAVMTNADGRFEWPLTPGRYRLSADTETLGHTQVELDVTRDNTAAVELTFNRP